MSWQPGIDSATLRDRSKIYTVIRCFFESRAVMEVTTPVLGTHGVSDLHIESLTLVDQGTAFYLQSSPEYSMKRLLASGSGSIYQICPAFRAGESGLRHSTEFSMLEWYRLGFSLEELIVEVASLLQALVAEMQGTPCQIQYTTYAELFLSHFGRNPHDLSLPELYRLIEKEGLASEHIDRIGDQATCNECLDLLFSSCIEPGLLEPTFVSDFPAGQAALAKVSLNGRSDRVARRFELYWQGIELANGYDELTDAEELRRRFEENNRQREVRGLPNIIQDEKLLASMSQLPDCAGVAVGVDRLVMLLCGKKTIDEVISFVRDRL